jgi:hypothetical protein
MTIMPAVIIVPVIMVPIIVMIIIRSPWIPVRRVITEVP